MSDFNKELEIAIKICQEAGTKIKEIFSKKETTKFHIKSKNQIVTDADLIAEEILISGIKQNFPNHSILSEEKGGYNKNSDYKWIIDPIDGTTNFAIKNPFFNTTVALTYKEEIVIGVVYAPIFNELYTAEKGEGAFLNDEKIRVSKTTKMEKGFHAFCHGDNLENAIEIVSEYYKNNLQKGYPTRQLGSAALELSRVGAGILDSMILPGAESWDIAAGALIVKEAGGVVKGWEGEEFNLKSKGIIATSTKDLNKKIYQEIKQL